MARIARCMGWECGKVLFMCSFLLLNKNNALYPE
jgi:hypothetical protein